MRDPLSRLLILGAAVAMVGILLLPISDDAPFGFSEPALPAFLTLAAVFLRPRGEPRRRPACCPRTVSRCLSIAMAAALVICTGRARTEPPVVVDDSVILAYACSLAPKVGANASLDFDGARSGMPALQDKWPRAPLPGAACRISCADVRWAP